MSVLIFHFYKYFLSPLARLILQILRPFLHGKVREMIEDKNQAYQESKTTGPLPAPPIWIHAASGEIEYARPLIRELKLRYPQTPLLVTYSSPSAKKILRQISEIDAWTALPWESSSAYARFFKTWRPRMLLVARTDLWPIMAEQISRENIPGFLFSATFAENSSRLRGLSKYLTLFSLNQLRGIFCVAESDRSNLQKLSPRTPVQVLGDSRFDQVLHRLQNPRSLRFSAPSSRFIFVMGSTWPQDEAVLLPALPKLKALGCQFILAPHEISEEHLQRLKKNLQERGLSCLRYSQAEQWRAEDVLLLDQIGILAELYTWGNVALVGGSFKKQVHSVMEPLAAGLPVLVGPHHLNNREAIDLQNIKTATGISMVQCVHDSNEIIHAVAAVQSQDQLRLRSEVVREIKSRTGSTGRLLERLKTDLG